MHDDDPGWPSPLRAIALTIPGLGRRAIARADDKLVAMRMVFLSFSISLVLFGVVLAVLDIPSGPVVPWLPVLAGVAVVIVAADRLTERPLDPTSDATLADSYRARLFIRIAFAQSIALAGFVLTFIGGPKWIYYPAAAFSLLMMWVRAAPTRRALERDQAVLTEMHARRSLVSALRKSGGEGGGQLAQ